MGIFWRGSTEDERLIEQITIAYERDSTLLQKSLKVATRPSNKRSAKYIIVIKYFIQIFRVLFYQSYRDRNPLDKYERAY